MKVHLVVIVEAALVMERLGHETRGHSTWDRISYYIIDIPIIGIYLHTKYRGWPVMEAISMNFGGQKGG